MTLLWLSSLSEQDWLMCMFLKQAFIHNAFSWALFFVGNYSKWSIINFTQNDWWVLNKWKRVFIQYYNHFIASFVAFSLATSKKVPFLTWSAASIFIALLTSGWASIPSIVYTMSFTFLFGSHSFYPNISWHMRPSLTLGW